MSMACVTSGVSRTSDDRPWRRLNADRRREWARVSRRVALICGVLIVVSLTACGEDIDAGSSETSSATGNTPSSEAPNATSTTAVASVSFDDVGDLCSYVTVAELSSIVQVDVRTGEPSEDEYEGVRYRGCGWDIGPEFVQGDNSDVGVNVNDRAFADDPLGGPANTTVAGRPARQSSGFEATLDMGGWTMGLSVYAGHNAAMQADPAFSSQALESFAALLIERIQAGG